MDDKEVNKKPSFPTGMRLSVAAQMLQAIISSRGHSIVERDKAADVKHALEYADQLLGAMGVAQ